jgi:hypothetical protein
MVGLGSGVRVHCYIDGAIRHPVKATHVLCPTPSVEFLQQLDPCVKDNSLSQADSSDTVIQFWGVN